MASKMVKPSKAIPSGVTVITATNKPDFMKNLFRNFKQQHWKRKELIVILNNNQMNMDVYKRYALDVGQVSIYRLPGDAPLGECLNYGIRKAKYGYIAKFDDDDYYAPLYLSEAMRTIRRTGADIVGKRKFFMYLEGSEKLLLAVLPSHLTVAGATILFKKQLYPAMRFSRLRVGSDTRFLQDSRKQGRKNVQQALTISRRSEGPINRTIPGKSRPKPSRFCAPKLSHRPPNSVVSSAGNGNH